MLKLAHLAALVLLLAQPLSAEESPSVARLPGFADTPVTSWVAPRFPLYAKPDFGYAAARALFNELGIDFRASPTGDIVPGQTSVLRDAMEDVGDPCFVPNDSTGFVGFDGPYFIESVTCQDFIGRAIYINVAVPDSPFIVLPRFGLVTADGTMDSTSPELAISGFGAGQTWMAIPGFDVSLDSVIAICRLTDQGEDCTGIVEPPDFELVVTPFAIHEDDAGRVVLEFGANDFGSAGDIIREVIDGQPAASEVIVSPSDLPANSTEAVGTTLRADFTMYVGLVLSRSPAGLEQMIYRTEDVLARVAVAGGAAPGTNDTFSTFPGAFEEPISDERTVAFTARLTLGAGRGVFAVPEPAPCQPPGLQPGLGPCPMPAAEPVILPGDVLERGTVREARLLDVAGDFIFVAVDYEPSGSDVLVVIPAPEPSPIVCSATALAVLGLIARRSAAIGTSSLGSGKSSSRSRRLAGNTRSLLPSV